MLSKPLSGPAMPSQVIFPGEISPYISDFGIKREDIRRLSKDKTMLHLNSVIYGIFFYKSPIDGVLRYTTFTYTVMVKDPQCF